MRAVLPTDDDSLHARVGLDTVESGLNLGRLYQQADGQSGQRVSIFVEKPGSCLS